MKYIAISTLTLLAGLTTAPAQAQAPSMLDVPASQIAAGGRHTCAALASGGAKCWGHNNRGQLGNGSTGNSPGAVPVDASAFVADVVTVAAGYFHSCALDGLGRVYCWGRNNHGQLGDGTTTDSAVPVQVATLVVAIAAGRLHTCALMAWGGVRCWGGNGFGQLGDGTTIDKLSQEPVDGLTSGMVAITAGAHHSCAVTETGVVKCWGRNGSGQLGDDTNQTQAFPQEVVSLAGHAVSVTAGGHHTCALSSSGRASCWGRNQHGQLGNQSTADSDVPVPVAGLGSGVAAISAGFDHTCALTTSGAVQCWGGNAHGQLGTAAPGPAQTPQPVTGLGSGMAGITTGDGHSCALDRFGGVRCWGANGVGQVGDGTFVDRALPTDVSGLASGVAASAGGAGHSCALTRARGAKCWGMNSKGQLGDGSITGRLGPVSVKGLVGGLKMIATGTTHTCAVTAAGGLLCWGDNSSGQLGIGAGPGQNEPEEVLGLFSGVKAVATGRAHTCAMTATTVECWGDNSHGQLGDGSTVLESPIPVGVPGLPPNLVDIAAGRDHTCVVTASGAVKCWGSNTSDQLGNASTVDSNTPVNVTNMSSGTVAIAAGNVHTCAWNALGQVKCWGNNVAGQLGTGDNSNGGIPVPVTVLSSHAQSVAPGGYHTCALTAVGGVECWGYNYAGQLGDGSMSDSLTARNVLGLASGVTALSSGSDYACAVDNQGVLKCWGNNDAGQLGNGANLDQSQPVSILRGQTITFVAPESMAPGGQASLSATASGGDPVTFDTWTPGNCVITGNLVLSSGGTGLCAVRASQAGGSDDANGTVAAAPPQLRLIRISERIFTDGFE